VAGTYCFFQMSRISTMPSSHPPSMNERNAALASATSARSTAAVRMIRPVIPKLVAPPAVREYVPFAVRIHTWSVRTSDGSIGTRSVGVGSWRSRGVSWRTGS